MYKLEELADYGLHRIPLSSIRVTPGRHAIREQKVGSGEHPATHCSRARALLWARRTREARSRSYLLTYSLDFALRLKPRPFFWSIKQCL